MARKTTRKLFLFGRYSLAMLLPKKWLTDLGAKRHDAVEMEYDRARKRIVLRFGNNSNSTPSPIPTIPTQKTKTPQSKPAESPDFQPIPEL